MKYKFLIVLLVLSSCSVKKKQFENQSRYGHWELYSRPNSSQKIEDKNLQRVVIAATNDVHGNYGPLKMNFKDKHNLQNQTIAIGGINYMSSYFKILRQEFGQILLVDSGDIFSSQTSEKNYVQDYYSVLDYDAITIGLNDFTSGTENLKKFSARSKTPVLLSNLYELKTARVVQWPGTLPYTIKEVNGVKIGIIALVPDDVAKLTPIDNRIGLYVENMLQSTLRNARLLRSLGAEIIVALTHQGLNCGEGIAQELDLPLSKVNFDPYKGDVCDLSSPLGDYLNRLPPNLVDVVIGGRNHQKTANFVNSTLVLSNFGEGQSFSFAELYIDTKSRQILKNKTVVHGPVLFCQNFFKETNDCYAHDQSINHQLVIPAKFLGHPINRDTSVEEKFKSYLRPEYSHKQ